MGRWATLTTFGVLAAVFACPARAPDGQRWWSHVAFLADDALEGRDTGSEGHRKAAEYVAREFEKARAQARRAPTASSSRSSCISRTIDEAHSSLALVRDGRRGAADARARTPSSRSGSIPPRRSRPRSSSPATGCRSPRPVTTTSRAWTSAGKLVVYLRGAPAVDPGPAGRAHAVGGRAGRGAAQGGGDRHGRRSRTRRTWTSPGSASALARFMPSMSLADPAMDETRRAEARRHHQPGPRRQAPRRLGPHLRRDPRRGRRRQAAAALRDPGEAQGDRRREAGRRGLAERRGRPARAPTRRSRTSTSSSPRTSITSASASRSTATRSTTARWTTPRASPRCSTWPPCSRSRARSSAGRCCSWPSRARRRACSARSTSPITRPSDAKHDRRRHQHRHVPAALSR